jgi:hypothetical protein
MSSFNYAFRGVNECANRQLLDALGINSGCIRKLGSLPGIFEQAADGLLGARSLVISSDGTGTARFESQEQSFVLGLTPKIFQSISQAVGMFEVI